MAGTFAPRSLLPVRLPGIAVERHLQLDAERCRRAAEAAIDLEQQRLRLAESTAFDERPRFFELPREVPLDTRAAGW
jgi:hypothetical protein